MTKAAFIKRDGGLFPLDDDGREMLAACPDDKPVMVDARPRRNIRHHRMLFALLRHCVSGGAWEGDEESLLAWLKVATGLVDPVIGEDGKVFYVLRSINFESMGQDAFSRWFDRAVYVICHRLLETDEWEALRDEIGRIVDGEQGERAREHAGRYGEAA